MLALHQPVAVDMRLIIAIIKINNDLERIGDQAVNIAQRVEVLARKPDMGGYPIDYALMADRAESMLKKSLDALINLDVELAFEVVKEDDVVDQYTIEAYDRIKHAMEKKPHHFSYWINVLLISRHLERLADHATNIAEEVIYLIEGQIVRHGPTSINELQS